MVDTNCAIDAMRAAIETEATSLRLAAKARALASEHPGSSLTVDSVEIYTSEDHPEFLGVLVDIGHATIFEHLPTHQLSPEAHAALEEHFGNICRRALAEVGR